MLDPQEAAVVREETDEQSRVMKRAVVVTGALKAVEELAQKNPDADLTLVIEALEQLAAADTATLTEAQLPSRAASDAAHVLQMLQRSQSQAAP
jgi:hypothetical protein